MTTPPSDLVTTPPSRELGHGFEVRVNVEDCCSSGRCAATEPTVFDQDPQDGTVVLLQAHHLRTELLDVVQLCASLCPCGAIEVIET